MADARVESVFAQALELPPGTPRERWVAEECGEDRVLRRDVEALLHAHHSAGIFLDAPIRIGMQAAPATGPDHGTANLSAAAHAEDFLRRASASPHPTLDVYLAALPTTIQREARERIEAGLRVRQWLKDTQGVPQRQAEDQDEALPQLPGFRIERKLGQGSLGMVYAARDEKLDRAVAMKWPWLCSTLEGGCEPRVGNGFVHRPAAVHRGGERLAKRLPAATRSGWLQALAWIAWLLAIPVISFGVFLLNALLTSAGPWNPAPDEAVIVPLTWLGSVLLPICG